VTLRLKKRDVVAATSAFMSLAFATAAQAADEIRFVACPIYRDTGTQRKAGCWLAEDPATGERYDVSSSPTKPDWNFGILVEGRPSAGKENLCGGKILEPVRVSVLDTPCTRFVLEAEGYKGRTFVLPPRNVRPLYEERKPAAMPFQARSFTIPFDFGGTFIAYQLADYYLDQAINYALDVQPARILIIGHAATAPAQVSGQALAEPKALAAQRADVIRQALILRGIPPEQIDVTTSEDAGRAAPEPFDGLAAPALRRVDIVVTPKSG
jgi:outer membrane protein OmpA-like peptidoglycan-associated protein